MGNQMFRQSFQILSLIPPHQIVSFTQIRILENKLVKLLDMCTIQYNTIQYNTIQYNTIQYNTIQYNTIQYKAKYAVKRNKFHNS